MVVPLGNVRLAGGVAFGQDVVNVCQGSINVVGGDRPWLELDIAWFS